MKATFSILWFWKDSLNSSGQQFHQYQQKEQSLLTLARWAHKNKWPYQSRSCLGSDKNIVHNGIKELGCYGSIQIQLQYLLQLNCRLILAIDSNQCLSSLTLWVRTPLRQARYNIMWYSDLRQVGGLLWVLWFPSSIKLTTTIMLKYCWMWR